MDHFTGSAHEFLNATNGIYAQECPQSTNDEVDPLLDDPSIVGIPHEMFDMLKGLEEKHGDETFKQVALFCLGQWLQIHQGILPQPLQCENIHEAMVTVADLTTLAHSAQQVQAVGSFGGDESWRKMLKEIVSQDILENMEEQGISVKAALGEDQMSGNVMDIFKVSFRDGSFFCLWARNLEHATLTAKEDYNASLIVMIERVGEWEDDEVEQ